MCKIEHVLSGLFCLFKEVLTCGVTASKTVQYWEIVSYSGSLFGTTFYQEPHYEEPHFSILYEDEMWFHVLKVLGMIWRQY